MADTNRLTLPLLAAAQAQKHVTVNEALTRLDGLVQLVLLSVGQSAPPLSAPDGSCYGVPAGASGDWAAHDGQIAIASGGGWVFATPAQGWRAYIRDQAADALFDGSQWQVGGIAASPDGAAVVMEVAQVDHVIGAGTTSNVAAALPANSIVYGVTGRVITAISGSLGSFRLGVAGSDNRYGAGLGLAQGSWLRGLTGSPLTYYSDEDLLLSAEGGDFAGGTIRLAVHLMRLTLPSA